MDKRILVINPGSTSTKLALFQGEQKLFDAAVRHSKEDLSPFSWVMEQADFRQTAIEKELSAHNVDLTTLDAVCARGGQLPYCAAGTYLVDQDMVDFMYTVRDAAHASNLGCVLALRIARSLGIPTFICDPVTVDEMTDEARLSGHPVLPRMMTGHALNCRAMALRCAADVLHKPLADCRLIVLHLGGGGSARLFIGGKMVDGVRDDEWMFAPERMGGVSLQPLVAMCYSGAYTKQDIMDLIRGKGGLMAHLGTASAQEVEQRIADGDAHAKLVYDGMLYSCARAVGGLAAAADGRVDRIILTGGLAHSHYVTGYLTQKLSFIAPVEVMAGEFELEALAAGASRVLNGQEQPRRFADIPQGIKKQPRRRRGCFFMLFFFRRPGTSHHWRSPCPRPDTAPSAPGPHPRAADQETLASRCRCGGRPAPPGSCRGRWTAARRDGPAPPASGSAPPDRESAGRRYRPSPRHRARCPARRRCPPHRCIPP